MNATESDTSEPPKPRLSTLWPGKACARFLQRRILELPMNRTAPRGGGLVLSAASNARMSFSHRASGGGFVSVPVWAKSDRFRASPIARADHVLDGRNRVRMRRYCEARRSSSKVLLRSAPSNATHLCCGHGLERSLKRPSNRAGTLAIL